MIELQLERMLLPLGLLGLVLALEGFLRSGVARPAWIAVLRAAVQLALLGLVLAWLFESAGWPWLALCMVLMLGAALREVLARQEDEARRLWPGTLLALAGSAACSLGIALIVLRQGLFEEPRLVVPLLGMMLGNSMNGISLSLQGFCARLREEREWITERLALGMTPGEALAPLRKGEMRRALTPAINSLATVGIVFLPGMMTGQLLAGASVMQAILYQYLVLLLIFLATILGQRIALQMAQRGFFDERHRLRLPAESSQRD